MQRFFGRNTTSPHSASREEIDTFLHLIESKEELAIDYINCWLSLRNFQTIPEQSLRMMPFFVNMKARKKKKRRKL